MADQEDVVAGEARLGGTMRLGAYPAVLTKGSVVAQRLRQPQSLRTAPAPLRGEQRLPRADRRRAGCVFSGTSPDGHLVEFVELPGETHPFFVGTQAHPELQEPADPSAPAVRRVRRRRAAATRWPSGCRSSVPR